jgi:hypothetical protein
MLRRLDTPQSRIKLEGAIKTTSSPPDCHVSILFDVCINTMRCEGHRNGGIASGENGDLCVSK